MVDTKKLEYYDNVEVINDSDEQLKVGNDDKRLKTTKK